MEEENVGQERMSCCSEGSQGETLSAVDLMKEEQEEEDVCMCVCV